MNYKLLPEFVKNFLTVPRNLQELISKNQLAHEWTPQPTLKFISYEGMAWFRSKKIILNPVSALFSLWPNLEGPIHIDGNANYAINFILQGHGEMQWMDVSGDEITKIKILKNGKEFKYRSFENITNCAIIDSWNKGDAAIVKINTPHRVVTKETHRICLSIRTVCSPNSFEEAIESF